MSKIDTPASQDWKQKLTDDQYRIAREGGTERAFSGKYWDHKGNGVYACVCCGEELFDSKTKFDSGSGWPSFFAAADPTRVKLLEDNSHGMRRIEAQCAHCDAHLGHVFPDGPKPTGERFCINSASLNFCSREEQS